MNAAKPSPGVLIVGHGTRNERGAAEYRRAVDDLAESLSTPVEAAFIELLEPSIDKGLQRLVERGAAQIAVVPLLLFAAGHAERDIPAAVDEFRRRFPWVTVQLAGTIDCAPEVLEWSRQRYDAACMGRIVPQESTLVLIARGNSRPTAQAEFRRFAELRRSQSACRHGICGFVAIAEPTLSAALNEAAQADTQQIIVQPHVLFTGEVLEQIRAAFELYRARYPAKTWVLAEHLGGGGELQAYLQRVVRAMTS